VPTWLVFSGTIQSAQTELIQIIMEILVRIIC